LGLLTFAKGGKPMPEQSPLQLINDWQSAAKKKDANTLESFYADKAVLCATEGVISDKSNISTDFAAQFAFGWTLTGISNQSINQGTDNDWAWGYGQWTGTVPNPNPNPPVKEPTTLQLQGCWSILFVNQGTSTQPNWLIQQHTIVTNPVPPDPLAPPQSAR
jgi:hypothetical protein